MSTRLIYFATSTAKADGHAADANPKRVKDLLRATPSYPSRSSWPRGINHVGNPELLNITIQGQFIHEDSIGPTSYSNPILNTEISTRPIECVQLTRAAFQPSSDCLE